MKSQEEAIDEITSRLVEFFHPVKIYLFGSTARGDAGPDSDLDFCVVVPDDTPNEKLHPGRGAQGCQRCWDRDGYRALA